MRAVIEPTGTSVRRGAVQIRIDLFLDEQDARYNECHLWVVDTDSAEYKAGYSGSTMPDWEYKVDEEGHPLDEEEYKRWKAEYDLATTEYQAWQDSLPHKWQDAPFHSHFIQLTPDATDEDVKKEVRKVLDGFGSEYEKNGDLVAYYHRNKKRHYAPFNVDAKTEALVFNALREGKVPQIVGETMSKHLVRSAIKGLDIAARKDEFKAVR